MTLCIPSGNKRIECLGLGSRHSDRSEAESKNGTLGQAESNGDRQNRLADLE